MPRDRVRRIKPTRAQAARLHPGRFSISKQGVASRAPSNPGRKLFRNGTVVRALADVAEIAGDRPPFRPVPHFRPGKRVRNLVQQHLVDFVIVEPAC